MKKSVLLDDNSDAIKYLCNKDKRFKRVYELVGPIRYEIHEDIYEFIIREIIEQMLSTKAASAIYSRLLSLCCGRVCPNAIDSLSDEEIKGIGTSNRKVQTIRDFTWSIKNGKIDMCSFINKSDNEVIIDLTQIKGIGTWTAKMVLIFALDRQDVLPTEDVAFIQGYKWLYKTDDTRETSVKKKCKKWSPYSSIAARYLYRALDGGLTKQEFHLYKTE